MITKDVIDYKLVCISPGSSSSVALWLNQGWVLYGLPVTTDHSVFQAVVMLVKGGEQTLNVDPWKDTSWSHEALNKYNDHQPGEKYQ